MGKKQNTKKKSGAVKLSVAQRSDVTLLVDKLIKSEHSLIILFQVSVIFDNLNLQILILY